MRTIRLLGVARHIGNKAENREYPDGSLGTYPFVGFSKIAWRSRHAAYPRRCSQWPVPRAISSHSMHPKQIRYSLEKRCSAEAAAEGQVHAPISAPAILVNCEEFRVRDVAHATCFDVREQTLQPIAIEASLLIEMTQQVFAAR